MESSFGEIVNGGVKIRGHQLQQKALSAEHFHGLPAAAQGMEIKDAGVIPFEAATELNFQVVGFPVIP